MGHPHVATARRRTLTSSDDRPPPSAVPTYSGHIASSPIGPQLHSLHSVPEDIARCKSPNKYPTLAARLAAVRMPMPFQLSSWHAQWLGRLRSALRLLVIVLSGAVLVFLGHTLEIFRGNRYIDLRKNELPMTWPARTNLWPTLILFTVALGTFIASVTIVALSFKRSFRRPTRSAAVYRVVGGCCGVLLWIVAIAEFSSLDRASKASLGRYSCGNSHILSNGRYQYRAVCEEQVSQLVRNRGEPTDMAQGVAFYIAIGAAAAEFATLLTLVVTTPTSPDQYIPGPKDDHEKKRSMSINGGTKRFP
ncbi:hypothetical protein PMIN01_02177 [Paraphaeosphaeria minitans]|uniref:Uncharacterized protein n=1 Tax=Paraphaeosphaeria minitans TaxID=565426 RepID=A0A9P6GQT8_9PLEO|nr:hypothetical protein PMIN01_02177 [Paraphaeosphaeria minitans]